MEDDSNPINTLSPSRASPIGLRHLRYAVAAADHGNFRRAAEALLLWTNKLVDHIREHGLDLALLWGNALPGAMLVKRLLMVWIGPKGYVAKRGEEIPLALFEPPCVFRQPGIKALERSGRRWRLALTSPSLTGLWATASAGLAITIRTTLGLRPAIGTTWAAK
jgi:DNA-binding transcriptional LysR family regulator